MKEFDIQYQESIDSIQYLAELYESKLIEARKLAELAYERLYAVGLTVGPLPWEVEK